MTIKPEHRNAKIAPPTQLPRNAECSKTLTYSGNIQIIPPGKGFQKIKPHDTFSSLQNKIKENNNKIKKYKDMINQAKK